MGGRYAVAGVRWDTLAGNLILQMDDNEVQIIICKII